MHFKCLRNSTGSQIIARNYYFPNVNKAITPCPLTDQNVLESKSSIIDVLLLKVHENTLTVLISLLCDYEELSWLECCARLLTLSKTAPTSLNKHQFMDLCRTSIYLQIENQQLYIYTQHIYVYVFICINKIINLLLLYIGC